MTIDAGAGATIDWTDNVFANRVATISFAEPRSELALSVMASVEQGTPAFPLFSIAVYAHSYPFAYSKDDRIDLGALAVADVDADRVATWPRGFVASDPTDTLALLKDLNAGISPVVVYRVRDDEGTQTPAETLETGSGSCRDIAALFIEAARKLGFGARAVSGYLYDREQYLDDPGSTHAWAERRQHGSPREIMSPSRLPTATLGWMRRRSLRSLIHFSRPRRSARVRGSAFRWSLACQTIGWRRYGHVRARGRYDGHHIPSAQRRCGRAGNHAVGR